MAQSPSNVDEELCLAMYSVGFPPEYINLIMKIFSENIELTDEDKTEFLNNILKEKENPSPKGWLFMTLREYGFSLGFTAKIVDLATNGGSLSSDGLTSNQFFLISDLLGTYRALEREFGQ